MKATAIEWQAIYKVIEVWKNREVYEPEFLESLKQQPVDLDPEVIGGEFQNSIRMSDLPESQSQLLLTQFSQWLKIAELQQASAESKKR